MTELTRGQQRSEYSKEYREAHKERLKELNKLLYNKKREKLLQKHNCTICHGCYVLSKKIRHESSKKHQAALEIRQHIEN